MDRKNPECNGIEINGRSVNGWGNLILLSRLLGFIKLIYL
jgi:hypothetical protein